MFQFDSVIKDVKDEAARRRVVTVQFKNELGHTKEATLSFSINETNENVKARFVDYLNELNFVPTPISDLTVTNPEPQPPTQAELDRAAFNEDRAQLHNLMEMVRDGVFTGTETQIKNLQTKVKNAVVAHPEYSK